MPQDKENNSIYFNQYQLKTWMYEYPQSHACCRNILFSHLERCSSSLWQVLIKDFLIQTNLHRNQLAEMKKVSGIQWLHVLMTGNNHWQQEVHNYQVKLSSRCYNWTTVPTKEAVVTSTYLRLCFLQLPFGSCHKTMVTKDLNVFNLFFFLFLQHKNCRSEVMPWTQHNCHPRSQL